MGDILSALQITATGFGATEADAVGPPGAPWIHASTAKDTVARWPCWAQQQVAMTFSTSATKKAVRLKLLSTSTRKKKGKNKSYERRGCLNPAELQQSVDTTAAQHPP